MAEGLQVGAAAAAAAGGEPTSLGGVCTPGCGAAFGSGAAAGREGDELVLGTFTLSVSCREATDFLKSSGRRGTRLGRGRQHCFGSCSVPRRGAPA